MRDDSTVNSLSVKNFKHNIGTILGPVMVGSLVGINIFNVQILLREFNYNTAYC